MSSVEFVDNSARVKAAINEAMIGYLYEAGGELEAQVKRNARVGTGQTKGQWQYVVDEAKVETIVGNPSENAIWEEFGTGEYALNHDGRKGGWWIKVGYGSGEMPPSVANKYKWSKVRTDKNGNKFVFTKGKKPNRALQTAFNSLRDKLIRMAQEALKTRMERE